MQQWAFNPTEIEGLIEVTPFDAPDIRGSFTKDYSREVFAANGIAHDLSEVFYTTSHRGVIRALHFQREREQAKLVRCIVGRIWDVVVDLRPSSPTHLKWQAFELAGDGAKAILVPGGCAHGYLVLEDSIVSYKCNEKFYGEYDDGIRWNDPTLAIPWPLERIGGAANLIIAEKDQKLNSFETFKRLHGGLR